MTDSKFPVYSISISGVLSWQLHALNNEGTEGNQSLTRRYYIIQKDMDEPECVNGVSGDMMKHIQAEHLHRIAIDYGLPLSEGGKQFHPDRIGYDLDTKQLIFSAQEKDNTTRIDSVLTRCAISDLEGFMVTSDRFGKKKEKADKKDEGKKEKSEQKEGEKKEKDETLKRESVIEFGTVVGLPNAVKTQSYFHAKYGTDNPTPFNVQISSGLYATVVHIEAFRIGYNPHNFKYAIDIAERKKRLDALLKSVLFTYMQPNGAKRSTHLPHPERFEGVIAVSTRRCPAPMISPLEADYKDQIDSLKTTLNNLENAEIIRIYNFESLPEFAEKIKILIDLSEPWESDRAEANK